MAPHCAWERGEGEDFVAAEVGGVVGAAPLPGGTREVGANRVDQPGVGVAGDQGDAAQAHDPANTRRQLRAARGDGLLAWVTSHSFRKTVPTALDQSGHSGRQVADQLGHSRPSMTQDVYLGRKVVNPTAADALDRFLSVDDPSTSPNQKHG